MLTFLIVLIEVAAELFADAGGVDADVSDLRRD